MPGLDGFQTVELIKRRDRHEDTAVIFLTAGDADTEQITRGYSAGAVDYMLKPVDPDMLRSKVAMLLELAAEERRAARVRGALPGRLRGRPDRDGAEHGPRALARGQRRALRAARPLADAAAPRSRSGTSCTRTTARRERDAVRAARSTTARSSHQSEKRFMRNDGELVHAIVSVSLTADSHDRPQGYIWQVVDVTEQRRAEAERAARAEAEAVVQTIAKLQQVTEAALGHLELDELLQRARRARPRGLRGGRRRASCCATQRGRRSGSPWARPRGFEARGRRRRWRSPSALAEVVERSRPVTIADFSRRRPRSGARRPRASRSVMAAPLMVRGRLAGAVEVGARAARRFTLEEESLLILMADRAGLAIEHARAYERELSNVETLQRSLLPDRLPQLEGVQVAARYMPGGADVGGDWYDALQLEGGRLGVAMGDVVGHGHRRGRADGAAAPRDARLRARGAPARGRARPARPARAQPRGRPDGDAAVSGGRARPLHRALASAGHVPPLVISPDGEAGYLEGAPNPPLGVFESPSAQRGRHRARAGFDAGPLHGRPRRAARRLDRRGPRGAAGGGLAGSRATRTSSATGWWTRCSRSTRRTTTSRVLALRALPTAPPPLHLELPLGPRPSSARCGASWAAGSATPAPRARRSRSIQIACHEACSNSIEHGYSFGPGGCGSTPSCDEGRVVLTVRDEGHWIERPDGPPRYRGQRPAADAGAHGLRRADARRQRDGGADVAELWRRTGWPAEA